MFHRDSCGIGNPQRNTVEIVFAGLGFVAIGGNFLHAKVKVSSPGGKGVGVRRPIVERLSGGYRLDIVKRKKIGRLIMAWRKSVGANVNPYFQTDVIGVGKSSVKGFTMRKDGENEMQNIADPKGYESTTSVSICVDGSTRNGDSTDGMFLASRLVESGEVDSTSSKETLVESTAT